MLFVLCSASLPASVHLIFVPLPRVFSSPSSPLRLPVVIFYSTITTSNVHSLPFFFFSMLVSFLFFLSLGLADNVSFRRFCLFFFFSVQLSRVFCGKKLQITRLFRVSHVAERKDCKQRSLFLWMIDVSLRENVFIDQITGFLND